MRTFCVAAPSIQAAALKKTAVKQRQQQQEHQIEGRQDLSCSMMSLIRASSRVVRLFLPP